MDPRTVSHAGSWAHYLHKLECCVGAHTRQELGVANVERSRRFSACDALEKAKIAVIALKYKLQDRSPELIGEFCSLAEQLVENSRRFVATDVVLQRVLGSGFTSSDEQRRTQIVNAIEAEMEKHSPARKQRQIVCERLATMDCRTVAERLRAAAALLSLPTHCLRTRAALLGLPTPSGA